MAPRNLLVAPALGLVLLVAAPLLALTLGASPHQVWQALQDPEVLSATGLSVACAAGAVALGLLLGVPAGYLLARRIVPGGRFWQALLDLPVVIPHPILGIGLLLVFARHRLVGAALRHTLGMDVVSAVPGIIVAMLLVSSPFIVQAARDGFQAVPQPYERAARSLGASPWRVFFTVSVPLAARSIRAGSLLAWARAVSEFGSIVIIAYYPRTAPVLIWDRFSAYGLRAAIAPALVLLAVCLAVFVILQLLGGDRPTAQQLQR